MKKTSGSITFKDGQLEIENALFTYSEEEKQSNEVFKSNASLIFSPEFIPYRIDIKKKFQLTHIETLLYGFIRFYKANSSNRFYFTNSQMADILDCSETTVSNAFSTLNQKKLIKSSYKIKSDGGKVRFVNTVLTESWASDLQKIVTPTYRKLQENKNSIKDNSIKREGDFTHTISFKEGEGSLEEIAQSMRLPIKYVKDTYAKVLDWEKSKGKPYKDSEAALRLWLRRDLEDGKIKKEPLNDFKKYL